jgi:hypothetical protein
VARLRAWAPVDGSISIMRVYDLHELSFGPETKHDVKVALDDDSQKWREKLKSEPFE